ncbi:MAG: ATP-binding cassette domain-containing protein [Acidobacteriota bacterium]
MVALGYQNIEKSYGDRPAVRDVSFDVQEGEIFGLLGPNGAGKTTLIRILMDIIRADRGNVSLFGGPVDGEKLDRVGYLPEERGLYKKQKTLEVLTYFGTLKGLSTLEARKRSAQWLDRVGLAETASWNVERLSKGMSQKIQVAASMLHEPDLAVLDEPFSGLDPVNVNLVQDVIKQRRRDGKTTILSTHQMDMVETLCDRVALISKGELMIYGEVNEVRRRYSHNELRVGVEGELPELPGVAESIHEENGTHRLKLQAGVKSNQVLTSLVNSGAHVTRFEEVLAPMHDIFITVVQGRG